MGMLGEMDGDDCSGISFFSTEICGNFVGVDGV